MFDDLSTSAFRVIIIRIRSSASYFDRNLFTEYIDEMLIGVCDDHAHEKPI